MEDDVALSKLTSELLACEVAVWEALKSGDADANASALDDGFLGVYPDGFATIQDHVGQLSNDATILDYALSEARVAILGTAYALLAYRAVFRRSGCKDRETMYVSSIWKRDGSGWISVFSQDTPSID
ncbi:MAG: nuclear transport factor 2 family protein [Pseudomonadota bacterium]